MNGSFELNFLHLGLIYKHSNSYYYSMNLILADSYEALHNSQEHPWQLLCCVHAYTMICTQCHVQVTSSWVGHIIIAVTLESKHAFLAFSASDSAL